MRAVLFGGSFDPVHLGHVAVADAARRELAPDRLLWMPARLAPHKPEDPPAPAADRLALLERVVGPRPGEEISTLELEREGPSYTVDTLEALRRGDAGTRWYLLLGADSQSHLPSWRRLDRILELAEIVLVPRPGWTELLPGSPARMLPGEPVEVSSSEVRRRLAAGESCAGLLPPGIEEEIRRRGLYQS